MTYQSTKTFGHEIGLSCAFRQWKADSHCKFVHGYALSFKFTFQAEVLNGINWVLDFGGLKELKVMLQSQFDHKLVIARGDPLISEFRELSGIAWQLVEVDNVGCESFAKIAFTLAEEFLHNTHSAPRVSLVSCECAEHGANSAIYLGELN